jgi:hypothetical protein
VVVHAANEGGRPRDRLGFADFRNIDGVCGFDFGFGGHKSLRLTSTSGWEAGVRTDLGHGPSAVLYPESPTNQTFVRSFSIGGIRWNSRPPYLLRLPLPRLSKSLSSRPWPLSSFTTISSSCYLPPSRLSLSIYFTLSEFYHLSSVWIG